MVFHRCAEAKSRIRSRVPGASVVRFNVGFDCASEGGKWFRHVVVMAMDVRKCRYFRGYLGLAEEIQGEFSWFEEMAPEGERKLVVDSCQDRVKCALKVWMVCSAWLRL